ncbi:hypothetical protein Zmor_028264 [Zophobas morio]|uniref:Uncharacterized protein n=1 Tax=Zophobas morio TaxID=2755281 RepID=A0AA38HRJ5_9CUCU|nr:hypothetical protein Zmor_028264 [Zophobas morio]
MATSNRNEIKQIIELKKENEKLQETINYLKMENFEYALKCNQIENILCNVKTVTRKNADKLSEASQNVCSILEECGIEQAEARVATAVTPEVLRRRSQSNKKSLEENSLRFNNKAHVVKPHMSSLRSNSKKDETNSSESDTLVDTSNDVTEAEPDPSQDFNTENQLSTLGEVSNASTSQSPAHSTVLSGNFHEVKIFLSPMSQDVLNKESRKAVNSKRRRRASSPRPIKYRSPQTCDYVTRSRRNN